MHFKHKVIPIYQQAEQLTSNTEANIKRVYRVIKKAFSFLILVCIFSLQLSQLLIPLVDCRNDVVENYSFEDVEDTQGLLEVYAASHAHSTACYFGHNHSVSGCSNHSHSGNSDFYGGCYTIYNAYSYDLNCWNCGASGRVICSSSSTRTFSQYYSSGATYCAKCKKYPSANVSVVKCNGCNAELSVVKVWSCSHLGTLSYGGSHSSVSCSVCGGDGKVTIGSGYYSLNCGLSEGYTCGYGSNDSTALCGSVVTMLVPINPLQTLRIGELPTATATATFLDGTTATVSCTYSGFNSERYNTVQTVTLSYGTYSGTAKNKVPATATMNVTINGYFDLEIASSNTVLGTVSGDSGSILCGKACTVTAIPIGANQFTGWYSGGTLVSSVAIYTFSMPASQYSLTAHFQRVPEKLSVTASSSSVYNGSEPIYTVILDYKDGTKKTLTSDQYSKIGFTRGAGTKTVEFTYTESGVTVSASIQITVNRNTRVCPNDHSYELDDYDNDHGCPFCAGQVSKLFVSPEDQTLALGGYPVFDVTAVFLDGHTEQVKSWTSDFVPGVLGVQYVTVSNNGFDMLVRVSVESNLICSICKTEYSSREDGSDPGCPYCITEVIALLATPVYQTVVFGDEISLAVTAFYLNGTSRILTEDEYTSSYEPYVTGEQTVTIGFMNQKTTIKAKVVTHLVQCANCGVTYNPDEFPGCPNCYSILTGIDAMLRSGQETVAYGTEADIMVIGIYLDGHREILSYGYNVTGYHAYVLGTQTITVTYEDKTASLSLNVTDNRQTVTCVNGHTYCLNSEGSDPGCPICNADEEDYVSGYSEVLYTVEFLDALYAQGFYTFEEGDYISIRVSPKETGFVATLMSMIIYGAEDYKAEILYGGQIEL